VYTRTCPATVSFVRDFGAAITTRRTRTRGCEIKSRAAGWPGIDIVFFDTHEDVFAPRYIIIIQWRYLRGGRYGLAWPCGPSCSFPRCLYIQFNTDMRYNTVRLYYTIMSSTLFDVKTRFSLSVVMLDESRRTAPIYSYYRGLITIFRLYKYIYYEVDKFLQ